ncbi:MAG TPA: sigma-70 family RNA polymerase sigma factor [Firmicutes bacterium]|nr:sigma-70 family RNA polymerase sigma factor [Bacillota bacterium]
MNCCRLYSREEGAAITEQEAVARVLAGDKEAYAFLVNEYSGYVLAVVLPVVPSPAEAEDAAQEAFFRAYENLADFRGGSFKAWLGRIALNCALDSRRRARRRAALFARMAQEATDLDRSAGTPAGPATEERLTLTALLARLPPQQKEVAYLYYFCELSYQEIAARLGISKKTVESSLYRARRWLRARWQGKEEG